MRATLRRVLLAMGNGAASVGADGAAAVRRSASVVLCGACGRRRQLDAWWGSLLISLSFSRSAVTNWPMGSARAVSRWGRRREPLSRFVVRADLRARFLEGKGDRVLEAEYTALAGRGVPSVGSVTRAGRREEARVKASPRRVPVGDRSDGRSRRQRDARRDGRRRRRRRPRRGPAAPRPPCRAARRFCCSSLARARGAPTDARRLVRAIAARAQHGAVFETVVSHWRTEGSIPRRATADPEVVVVLMAAAELHAIQLGDPLEISCSSSTSTTPRFDRTPASRRDRGRAGM